MPVAELTRIAEDVLGAGYGASSLDYQWIEPEDPRVGPIDEEGLTSDILAGLKWGGQTRRVHAEMWSQAGTVQVVREGPRPTSRGKILPFTRERCAGSDNR